MIVLLQKTTEDHYTPYSFHSYSVMGAKFLVSCSTLNYWSQLFLSIFFLDCGLIVPEAMMHQDRLHVEAIWIQHGFLIKKEK